MNVLSYLVVTKYELCLHLKAIKIIIFFTRAGLSYPDIPVKSSYLTKWCWMSMFKFVTNQCLALFIKRICYSYTSDAELRVYYQFNYIYLNCK